MPAIVGVTLTGLSGLALRWAPPGDLDDPTQHRARLFELRNELAAIGQRMADERGEPPLSEQG